MFEPAIRNQQILVVDDEQDHLELCKENLEDAGFVCFTATSGQSALEILASEKIDLAVVDVRMPEMSGPELFTEVKVNYPGVAVVFLSVETHMDVAVSHLKSGALDYLVKPVSKAELIQAVNDALEKQNRYLESYGQQEHLEELLLHQSKALENKVREVKALNRMFAKMPTLGVREGGDGPGTDGESDPLGTN